MVNKVAEHINRAIERVTKPYGLSVSQYGLLVLLQAEGPQPQTVLSNRVGLDRTTVMRTVDLLEERGFVLRGAHPTDRRKHHVTLTEAGEQLLEQTLSTVRQAEGEVAAALSSGEQAQLRSLLGRLLESQGAG